MTESNQGITSILGGLKGFSIDLSKFAAILPLLISRLPETEKIGGKIFRLRESVSRAVADGDIDTQDVIAWILEYMSLPVAVNPALPPAIKPVPHIPDIPELEDPRPPGFPSSPVVAPQLWPSSLTLDIHSMFLKKSESIPFRVVEHEDYYQVERTDGVDSITGRVGFYLGVGYIDTAGQPINFEDRGASHLYDTAQWFAVSEDGRGEDDCYAIGPREATRTENGVVNFVTKEAGRTGMMDVPLVVVEPPATARRPQFVRVGVRVRTPTQTVSTKPLRLPPIR